LANYDCLVDNGPGWVGRLTCSCPQIHSVLEIIELEAEVVDSESICLGNVPVQSIHPDPQLRPQGIFTLERENQLDLADAHR